MPALPAAAFPVGSQTEAQFKTFLTDQRAFLAGLLGTDGNVPTALATLGALAGVYAAKTGAYTVVSTDRGQFIEATTGTWTLALLAVASAGAGFSFVLSNTGGGTITINPNGAQQINGVGTLAVLTGEAYLVVCDGSAWRAILISRTIPPIDSTTAALTISDGTIGAGNSAWNCEYMKLGNSGNGRVLLNGTITGADVTGMTGSAALRINLPEPSVGTYRCLGTVLLGGATFTGTPVLRIEPGASYATIARSLSGGAISNLTCSNLSGANIDFTVEYPY